MIKIVFMLFVTLSTKIYAMELQEVAIDKQEKSDDEKWVLGCQIPFENRFLLDMVFVSKDESRLNYLKKRSPWFSQKVTAYPNLAQTCESLKKLEELCVFSVSRDPEDAALRVNFNEETSINIIKNLTKNIEYIKEIENVTPFNSRTVSQKIMNKGLDPENEEHEEAIKQVLTPDELIYHTKRMMVHRHTFAAPVGDRKKLSLLLGLLQEEHVAKGTLIRTQNGFVRQYEHITFEDDLKYLINDAEGTDVNHPKCLVISRKS